MNKNIQNINSQNNNNNYSYKKYNISKIYAAFQPEADKFVKQVNKYDIVSKQPLNPVLEGVIRTTPYGRRILYIEDNVENNNPFKAVGLGLIGLINVKEDLRDLMTILGRSKSEAPKGYFAKFKYFIGTPFENWLRNSKWGQKILYEWDTSIADTKYKEKIYKFLGVTEDVQAYEKETKIPFCKPEIVNRIYVKHEGNFLGRLTCLTLNRITKISLLVMSLLELPAIYKAVKDKKDYPQIPKSAANVVSYSVCGALGSSLLSLATGHPAGSVFGLGLGMFIGNKISKLIYKDK